MPELDEYQKDKEEYAEALDAVFDGDKSDDEINKELDDKLGKRPDEAGDATGDSADEPGNEAGTEDDKIKDPSDQDPGQGLKNSDTTDDGESDCTECTAMKLKLKEAEDRAEKAEQKMSSWNGRIKAANARVKELEGQLSDKGPSADELSDQEKIDQFVKDFPEFSDVVDVMDNRYKTKAKAKDSSTYDPDAPLDGDDDDATAAKAKTDTTSKAKVEPTDHYKEIVAQHPDIDELERSGVLITWIRKQPDYIRPHLDKVLTTGTSNEVNNMVTEFKTQTGWKSQLETDADPKKRKLQAMLNADGSESPGPKAGGPDKNDYKGAAEEAFKEEK